MSSSKLKAMLNLLRLLHCACKVTVDTACKYDQYHRWTLRFYFINVIPELTLAVNN